MKTQMTRSEIERALAPGSGLPTKEKRQLRRELQSGAVSIKEEQREKPKRKTLKKKND